jgi:hypothetical protein
MDARHIKLAIYVWSTKYGHNQKLIAQFVWPTRCGCRIVLSLVFGEWVMVWMHYFSG